MELKPSSTTHCEAFTSGSTFPKPQFFHLLCGVTTMDHTEPLRVLNAPTYAKQLMCSDWSKMAGDCLLIDSQKHLLAARHWGYICEQDQRSPHPHGASLPVGETGDRQESNKYTRPSRLQFLQ